MNHGQCAGRTEGGPAPWLQHVYIRHQGHSVFLSPRPGASLAVLLSLPFVRPKWQSLLINDLKDDHDMELKNYVGLCNSSIEM